MFASDECGYVATSSWMVFLCRHLKTIAKISPYRLLPKQLNLSYPEMNKKKLRQLLIGEFSWQRLIRSIIFVYLAIGVWGYFFSNSLIFQPQPATYSDNSEILKLKSANGMLISAVYLPNERAKYTILYSHGNAEDLGDILPGIQEIQAMGFAVFSYDYQGYGTSEGQPTVERSYQDIDAAYYYLTQTLGIPPNQIIIYGRSVGGGPSVDLAAREPVAGLILESTFVSAFRALTHVPLYPFDKFENLTKIKQVNCPVLVIHGTEDEVVHFWHGQALFAAAQEPKLSLWVEGAGHNDVIWVAGDRYSAALREFVKLLP